MVHLLHSNVEFSSRCSLSPHLGQCLASHLNKRRSVQCFPSGGNSAFGEGSKTSATDRIEDPPPTKMIPKSWPELRVRHRHGS
jgi:hypothetical protein